MVKIERSSELITVDVTPHGASDLTWQATIFVTGYRVPEIFVSRLAQRIIHT